MDTRAMLAERMAARRAAAVAPTPPETPAPALALPNPYGTTTTKGRAFELLRKGMRPMEAARALEVSPSLISQYFEEEEFKEGVRAGLALRNLARRERDERIDALEDAALLQLQQVLPYITKPMEALRAVQVLNSLQRRAATELDGEAGAEVETVVLHLPKSVQAVQVSMKFNTANEVVEVNGRELRTMTPTGVMGALEARQAKRLEGRVEVENEHGTVAF